MTTLIVDGRGSASSDAAQHLLSFLGHGRVKRVRLGVAFAVTVVALAAPTLGYSRWSVDEMDAEDALSGTVWGDGRIVADALCVALDGGGSSSATRFACQIQTSYRPPSVQPARWEALAAAMRSKNISGMRAALGLTASSTRAEYAAAWHKWGLDRLRTVSMGVAVEAGRRNETQPVSLNRSTLTAVLEAKRHLRTSELSIACVSITTHKLTVSNRGTHSTAFLGPCSADAR